MAASATAFASEPTEYRFSRAPQQSARATVEAWAPLLKRISVDSGVALKLIVYDNREKFEADFLDGVPDFTFGNPLYAVMGRKRSGYVPILRDDARKLTGIIVVRADSAIKNVQDLAGKAIGFPGPNAMAASLYPRALLSNEFGLTYRSVYLGVHENVYRSVFLGQVDAGGGVASTLDKEPADLRNQLRVLYETPGIVSHPLLVHPRVPKDVQKKVADAFLALANDAIGQELLAAVSFTKPVLADYKRDYAEIERLHLESLRIKTGIGSD